MSEKGKAKVLGLKQIRAMVHDFLEGLPQRFLDSFGKISVPFVMIIWGDSGNGKTSLLYYLLKVFMQYGKVLYLVLEEGHGATTQLNVMEHLGEEYDNKIRFADHTMTYEQLKVHLKRRASERFVVIDSVQYWDISYIDYKKLKQEFPTKAFVFVSHAQGKLPDGKTANKIMYDACMKVRVQGFIAFVKTRFRGKQPYVIWEEGARVFWGKKYKEAIKGITEVKKVSTKSVKVKGTTPAAEGAATPPPQGGVSLKKGEV